MVNGKIGKTSKRRMSVAAVGWAQGTFEAFQVGCAVREVDW
jgi:hypothetical protein